MTPGILLLVVGAIFAFAVKKDTDAIDLQVMGVILMLGGAALIYHSRQDSGHLHETTTIDDLSDPNRPVHVVREYTADDQPTHDAKMHLAGIDDDAPTGETPPVPQAHDPEPQVHEQRATPTDEHHRS